MVISKGDKLVLPSRFLAVLSLECICHDMFERDQAVRYVLVLLETSKQENL